MKHSRKLFMSKWMSGFCATGKSMQRWNMREQGHCPFCKTENETTLHILVCPNAEPTTTWSNALIGFNKRLTNIDTSPLLRHHILEELKRWRDGSEPQNESEISTVLRPAILEQRKIGWKEFLEGLVSSRIHIY